MAAALLEHHGRGRVAVRSAGTAPAGEVNPLVCHAMSELGIDITRAQPQQLTSDSVEASDVVITMGCGDACPVYPGTRYLDWPLDDPAGQPLEVVRKIRDEIEARVRGLLNELDAVAD
ncbi:arsenate reductase ArsC [Haloechinothrix sp. LS1_15]|uniref:arsenate reductase ArsC n=1 Tax=Haloechinothrix sp. LS1_15 TaxID=2652248 RepID=UPI0037C119A4